jgi:uncharacterized protein (DUF952 family)
MTTLLHITSREQWQTAQAAGIYRGDTLKTDGFIHCSLAAQVIDVANTLYQGRDDLVLLVIDEAQVEPEVRYEDCYETGQHFPHLYGPLNVDAVRDVLPFSPGTDGTFRLPEPLRSTSEDTSG